MRVSYFFKNTKPFGRLVGVLFIYVACIFLTVPLASLTGLIHPAEDVDAARLELLSEGLAQLVVFLLSAILFVTLFCEHPREALGLRLQGRYWLLGLVGAVIIILLIPATDWLSVWNEKWTFGSQEETMRATAMEMKDKMLWLLSPTSAGDLLLQVFVMALVPAVCEELFFRGALQPTLQAVFRNSHVGILFTAIVFSLAHGDMYGFLPRLLLGLLLGYLYWGTGSLVVNVCAHFVNNMVVVVACHFYNTGVFALNPFEPIGLPWALTAGCSLGAILLFYLYFVKNPKNLPAETDSTPSAIGR